MKHGRLRKQAASPAARDNQQLLQLLMRGTALHRQGELTQAEAVYKQVLEHDPNCADAWQLLGVMAHQCNQDPLAIDLLRHAIGLDANQAPYHYNLAVALHSSGELAQAAQHYRRAVKLQPDHVNALENLGVVEIDRGHFADARRILEKVLLLNPRSQLARLNLGTLYNRLQQSQQALACFEEAVRLHPSSAEARMKRGTQRLSLGELAGGWEDYAWRWFSAEFTLQNRPQQIPYPRWDDRHPDGRKLLVVAEQGLGDEIMFATCLPDLLARAARVYLACDLRLHRLFAGTYPQVVLLDRRSIEDPTTLQPLGEIDGWLYLADLPGRFRCEQSEFPKGSPRLQPDPGLIQAWRERLKPLGAERVVGISWQGGREVRGQQARSLPLPLWRELLEHPGTCFVNLQYGDHRQQIAELNRQLHLPLLDFSGIDPLQELDSFAALIAALDLVITVDNSTAHLAGAIGTPTWVLLPQPADWRWFGHGESTPWYDALRLIRQPDPSPHAWSGLLQQVMTDLEQTFFQTAGTRICLPQPATATSTSAIRGPSEPPPAGGPRVLLLNDTSGWYHWGCSCTSLAIHRELRRRGLQVDALPIQETPRLPRLPKNLDELQSDWLFNDFEQQAAGVTGRLRDCRLVVINGEGTLHGTGPVAINLLCLTWLIQCRLGIPVQIINHSCYPDDNQLLGDSPAMQFYREIYRRLDFVAVREETSADLLAAAGIQLTRSFDCLPLFVEQQQLQPPSRSDKLLVAGSVAWTEQTLRSLAELMETAHREGLAVEVVFGARAWPAADDLRFIEALSNCVRTPFSLVNTRSETEWLRLIGSSRLLVSGRFHHSLAAACLGTPFLLLPSNTPKTTALLSLLEREDQRLFDNDKLSEQILCNSRHLLDNPPPGLAPDLRSLLLDRARANFAGLSKFC